MLNDPSSDERPNHPPKGSKDDSTVEPSGQPAAGNRSRDEALRRRAMSDLRSWVALAFSSISMIGLVSNCHRQNMEFDLKQQDRAVGEEIAAIRVIGYSASALESALFAKEAKLDPESPGVFFATVGMSLRHAEEMTVLIENNLADAPGGFWKKIAPIRAMIADAANLPVKLSEQLRNEPEVAKDVGRMTALAAAVQANALIIARRFHEATVEAYPRGLLESSGLGQYFGRSWSELVADRDGG